MRDSNPFAALADVDEPEVAPAPVVKSEASPDCLNETKPKNRRARRNRKQRSLLRRIKQQLMRLLKWPKDAFVATVASIWSSLLDAIGNRQRSAELESTVRRLVSRIDALEKLKNERSALQSTVAPAWVAPASLAAVPTGMVLNSNVHSKETALPSSDDPSLEKFKKMLAVGVPEPAVRQKMMKDNVDPNLLFAPPPAEERKTEFKRSVKAESKATATPVGSLRSLAITVAALEEVRNTLRSAGPRQKQLTSDDKENVNRPASLGFSVSVSTLQEIRGSLRKAPRRTPQSSAKDSDSLTKSPRIRDITNLRTTNETPYKTPLERRQNMSPSTARSDGEFLQLALLRRFQNVSSSPL